ncbi:adenylate cyclase [Bacillus sp. Marseille-P3661]|uniref:adenylate cyclase n=1 Tax=Bacillus sp. Marseille-P3661 TaxID=1936234 RepID=UPI000C83AE3C|nr:adenylate cyclase [Bacillus sp. Marseille-P3661]
MGAGKKIDRKFIVENDYLLEHLDLVAIDLVEQRYIAVGVDEEVRIRSIEDYTTEPHKVTYYLSIKKGQGMARIKTETEIKENTYIQLFNNLISLKPIIKKRLFYDYCGHHLTIYKYFGKLEGLTIVKVEFDSEKEAEKFEIPHWFSTEITDDFSYRNQNLFLKINDIVETSEVHA